MKRFNPKERGLIKGALRRVFSRSELRNKVLERNRIEHINLERSRAKSWYFCSACGLIEVKGNMQVDHCQPIIALCETLGDLTITQLADRIWCAEDNLKVLCIWCHKTKTKEEAKQRAAFKKMLKMQRS